MMPGDKAPAAKPFELDNAFELKNAPFMLMTLTVHEPDAKRLTQMLKGRFGSAFFDETPLLIDIQPLAGRVIDLVWVVDTLKQMRACPIGVLGARDDQLAMAVKAGLAVLPEHATARLAAGRAEEMPEPPPVAAPAPAQPEVSLPPPAAAAPRPTMVVDRPVRTGQQIYARGGDLVVLDSVAAGAELLADGSIHVYGPLRGRAHAGVSGEVSARIFAHAMDPQLVSIAGIYRTIEEALPADVLNRPAQAWLTDERIVFAPLNAHL